MSSTPVSRSSPDSRLSGPCRFIALVAVALGLYLYLGRLESLPLQRGNEAMYAYPPIRMLQSGDYLVPHYEGRVFLEKPPLGWWIIAASYRLLGISVFAERLPSALASLGTVLFVGLWSRRRAGDRSGWLAALVLMFSFQFVFFTLTYATDAFLTLAVAIAAVTLDGACRREDGSDAAWGARSAAVLALAFYFKGLVGIVLPVGGVAAGLLIDRQKPVRFLRRGTLGAVFLLALLAPWHWAMSRRLGWEFWRSFYWENQFLRGASSLYMRPRGPFYYLGVLGWGVFPWSFFLPGALRRRRSSSVPLGWLAFALLFWSLLLMKREVYLMPLFPAAAVLVGEGWNGEGRGAGRWHRWAWVLAAAASALGLALWVRAFGSLTALAGAAAAVFVGVGLVCVLAALATGAASPEHRLSPFLVALACGVVLVALKSFESRLARFDPLPAWGERAAKECSAGCDAFLYGINAYSLDFYSRFEWVWVADPPREIPQRLHHDRAFLVMWSDLEPVLASLPFRSEVLDRRIVFERDWAATLLRPGSGALRSLSLVRLERRR